jgi:putative Holliday junction resolvase
VSHKRVIALDLGEKRIGVAVADSSRVLAMPWAIVERQSDYEATYLAIRDVLEDIDIDFIVVGLPVSLSGKLNQAAERISDDANKLLGFFDTKWVFWDERNSSKEAFSLLRGAKSMSEDISTRHSRQNSTGKSPTVKSRDGSGSEMSTRKNTFLQGKSSGYPKTRIDDKAAAVILQSYLDAFR